MSLQDRVKASNPKDAVGVHKVPLGSVISGQVMGEVALAMLEGSLKYGRHNYRAVGVRASVYYDAFKRHIEAWWEGQDMDPGTDNLVHHISKTIADLVVLRDAMLQDKFYDDRPPPATNQNWVDDLNEKSKALIAKYPDPKPPFTRESVTPKSGV